MDIQDSSLNKNNAEIQQLRKKQQKTRKILLLASVVAVLFFVIAVFSFWKMQKANTRVQKTNELLYAFLPEEVKNIYTHFKILGDKQFALGAYAMALKNYKLAKYAPDKPGNDSIVTDISNAENCYKYQQKALEFIEQAKYELAETEIMKALKLNPKSRNDLIIASAIHPIHAMILVEGGNFEMGSSGNDSVIYTYDEEPIQKINLESFKISRYEVTNLQYALFLNRYEVGADGKKKNSIDSLAFPLINTHSWGVYFDRKQNKWKPQKGFEFLPVIEVTWYGANEYARFHGGNLPTEAQWEYAARGGKLSKNYRFAGSNKIKEVAWFSENANSMTHEVGLLKPNQLGIYDLSGNVWEWCNSWYVDYGEDYLANADTCSNCKQRVARGGSWGNFPVYCRVADRFNWYPHDGSGILGFRLCLNTIE